VKNWSKEDVEIVMAANMDLFQLESWFLGLYKGYAWSKCLPDRIRDRFWEEAVGEYKLAKKHLVKRMIMVKIRHTKDVVEAGWEIANLEKSFDWNWMMVVVSCFLHDIGRFRQASKESFEDWETDFDHGAWGAKIVEGMDFSGFGIDQERIVGAVRWHNKYGVSNNDKYVNLVRDADKLALYRNMRLLIERADFPEGRVSEAAVTAYLSGKMVRNEDIRTENDVYLRWLSWKDDLNFGATKGFLKKERLEESIMESIKKDDFELWKRLGGK
jgi:HD superfamily phosphohydrolase YqeK